MRVSTISCTANGYGYTSLVMSRRLTKKLMVGPFYSPQHPSSSPGVRSEGEEIAPATHAPVRREGGREGGRRGITSIG